MTTSSWLMLGLIAAYLVTAVVAACEQNWPRVLYWVAAGLITSSVLWGMR